MSCGHEHHVRAGWTLRRASSPVRGPERGNKHDRCWQILLQKSKIERPRKSRESRFLDAATAAKPSMADTKTGGRFCVK